MAVRITDVHKNMEDSGAAADHFRRRMGFLGLVGVGFTCTVYLMTLLRPVMEPFMWALFLVIAMKPLATCFENTFLCIGRVVCGCGTRRYRTPARSRLHFLGNGEQERLLQMKLKVEEIEMAPLPDSVQGVDDSEAGHDLWHIKDGTNVEGFCASFCAVLSRALAIFCVLAVVLGVMCGFAMLVAEGVLRVRGNVSIYEKGVMNAMENTKRFLAAGADGLPQNIVDEISEKAQAKAKVVASDLVSEMLSEGSRLLVELLMLGLYVIFWLCAPMPLNSKTESIFRRYLFLKGSSCIVYGISVGTMLKLLRVELALLFGVMSFFFSFIPEVGALIALSLPIPIILFDSRLETPFLTATIATSGQLCLKFIFANIIEVKLVESDAIMKMHPVVTLLAVTFFGLVWGPTGMLLCVPMMTYLKVALLSDYVPPAYRNPVLVLLEGDRRAPERHLRRLRAADRRGQLSD